MGDLLESARELRQRLHRLEVLLDIEKGRGGPARASGKTPKDAERIAAVKRLEKTGLIEPEDSPAQYRLTPDGRDFLKEVRAKIAADGAVDWTRVDEIDFSRL